MPGVKKLLPTTAAAGKRTFWCGRPWFSARTSTTRRVVEKLCVALIFWRLTSQSPKAGHNQAGRSDFRNQRFKPDTGKMWKMRKVPLTQEKQGSEEIPLSKNAENADTKTRKIRLTGFNVIGFRSSPYVRCPFMEAFFGHMFLTV